MFKKKNYKEQFDRYEKLLQKCNNVSIDWKLKIDS